MAPMAIHFLFHCVNYRNRNTHYSYIYDEKSTLSRHKHTQKHTRPINRNHAKKTEAEMIINTCMYVQAVGTKFICPNLFMKRVIMWKEKKQNQMSKTKTKT